MSRECPHQEPPHLPRRPYTAANLCCEGEALDPKAVGHLCRCYAGVKTECFEGVVDTAGKEAVIGSTAMERLRSALSQFGLRPVEASGTTATCACIGGSAAIKAVYDIPIGVAKTNGLWRVTEIEDVGSFQTPFLLPISFIELVGGIIDTLARICS